jgi:hypothetical protein
MWMLWMALAEAGSLTVWIELDGEKSKVEIGDMAACEPMMFKAGAFPDVLEVNARVAPQEEGNLLVEVGVKRKDGERSLEMRPTMVVNDGKKGVLKVNAGGEVASLEVLAKDFGTESCGQRRSRTTETRTRD